MSAADQVTSSIAAMFVCLDCGATGDQHQGKSHKFRPSPNYDPSTWKRGAHFSDRELNPATPLYITVEDRLRVSVFNSIGAPEVDVIARLQLPSGEVIPIRQQYFPGVSANVQNFDFDLCEGFLLDVSALTPTAAVRVGQTFAIIQLIRGAGANALPSRTLISNYLSSGNVIGWPEGPNQQSVQGSGLPRTSLQGNPAAGADFVFQVPNGQRWLIQSFTAQLVTAATVANRIPHIQIVDPGGNVLWDCAASAAQAASLTVRYSACGGIQPTFNDGSAIIPIPDVGQLLQGWKLQTVTTGIQAADQWQNPNINAIAWVEP